jgi:hypothetical protein
MFFSVKESYKDRARRKAHEAKQKQSMEEEHDAMLLEHEEAKQREDERREELRQAAAERLDAVGIGGAARKGKKRRRGL